MRLIDADVLIKEINENKELFEAERVYLEGIILNAPTVIRCSMTSDRLPLFDLTPRPRGEWTDVNGDGSLWKCNKCGEKSCCKGNYCPDCGEKMQKGGAE